jgi:hypothetical protein
MLSWSIKATSPALKTWRLSACALTTSALVRDAEPAGARRERPTHECRFTVD